MTIELNDFQARLAATREARKKQNAVAEEALKLQAGVDYTSGNDWYGRGKKSGQSGEKITEQSRAVLDAVKIPTDWTFAVDDVPSIPTHERSQADQNLDQIIEALSVTVAYRRWIPKGEPVISYAGQIESIMVRCPMPHHEDEHPSAWCNNAKNLWYCAACGYGGDIYDLAAIRFGYSVPSYKTNGQFRQLRADMARDFGIQVVRGVNGQEFVVSDGNGLTAPATNPTPPALPQIPEVARPFTVPGLKPISVATPQVGTEFSLDDVAATIHGASKSSIPRPTIPAPGVPPVLPVIPPTIPPVISPAPISHQFGTPVVEVIGQSGTPQIPAQSAVLTMPTMPALPLMPQFPGMPVGMPSIPVIGRPQMQTPSGLVIPALPLAPFGTQINLPDAATLEGLGLSAETGEVVADNSFTGISLDWRSVTADGTFLDKYMELAIQDDCPEEFHFFSALAALGLAVGRDLALMDRNPVKGNLNMCFLGPSGDGKSNAKRYLHKLMRAAMPYDDNDMGSKGVKQVSNPASGEVMVREFMKKLMDPANPKETLAFAPVRGVIDFPEFATLMKRAGSQGNTMVQFLMQFFDNDEDIRTSSVTNGIILAKDSFATVISTSQPKALKDLVSEEHVSNGFLNRWLFVTGKTKMGLIDPIGEEEIDISSLIKPIQNIWGWSGQLGLQDPRITWSNEAKRAANEFIRDVIYPTRLSDESGGLVSRADLMFKKFVLLFTINVMQPRVPVESVRWAIEMYHYIMATYSTLDKAVHHNVSSELRAQVVKAVVGLHKKNNRPPSLKQIADKVGHRQWSDKHILECIQSLVKLGHLEELPPEAGGPGRKAVRYQLVASGE